MSILGILLKTPVNRLEDIESNFGKITGNIDQAMKAKWLEKAIIRDGKYILQVYTYADDEEHPEWQTWHPTYYVLNEDLTKTRINFEVAYELYKTGKVGWEISRDSYVALHSKKTR